MHLILSMHLSSFDKQERSEQIQRENIFLQPDLN